MVERLINKTKDSPIRANVKSVVKGGATLQSHWNERNAVNRINDSTQWHYVVLQDQSNWAMHTPSTKNGYFYARKFADEITKIGAVPVIFVTWPKELNSDYYRQMPFLKSFGFSYKALNYHSGQLAKSINAQTVPVNDYWVKTLQNYSTIKLYSDGSHPTPAGTYLAAAAFYKFFTGQPLKTNEAKIGGIDKKTMATLRYVVSQPTQQQK